MARITIDMPQTYTFDTELDVRISDINYGNHLGHDAFISLLHEARVRFFNALGYTEVNVEGVALVVSDLVVVYKAQSFYGDRILIEMAAGEFNRYGCDLFYRVTRPGTGKLVLTAKTGIVFVDPATAKVSRLPQAFADKTVPPGDQDQV